MSAGFYKLEDNSIFFGPNYVLFPDGTSLSKDLRMDSELPVRGWYWFDSRAEALAYFGKEEYVNQFGNKALRDKA